ncbi:MAG TPA: hypothetical protein PLL53_15275 [Saprospiraceae bacterium]|nr:hypothetical protein [Saprospiraceae bacterium]
MTNLNSNSKSETQFISEGKKVDSVEAQEVTPQQSKKKNPIFIVLKKLLFSFFWAYFIARIFITDIDLIIAKNNGIHPFSYLTLRIVIFFLIVFFTWIKIGNTRFWKNIGLLLLHPFYPLIWIFTKNIFWEIPKTLYNNRMQVLLYYYVEGIIAFFTKFKFIIFKFLLFIFGFHILFTFDTYILFLPIFIFSFLQMAHLAKRFRQTFSPIKIFNLDLNIEHDSASTDSMLKKIDENFEDKDEVNSNSKVFKHMEAYLLTSAFAKAFNLKLKEVINNRTYMLSFLGKSIYSFILTMIYIGAINYAVYKINPTSFKIEYNATYFDFFYYSFFTIFPDGTDIEPIEKSTKSIRMIGVFIGVIINLLLLTVYLTISNEKFKENLEKLYIFTEDYSKAINQRFEEKFGHSPTQGLQIIKGVGSSIESVISSLNKLGVR